MKNNDIFISYLIIAHTSTYLGSSTVKAFPGSDFDGFTRFFDSFRDRNPQPSQGAVPVFEVPSWTFNFNFPSIPTYGGPPISQNDDKKPDDETAVTEQASYEMVSTTTKQIKSPKPRKRPSRQKITKAPRRSDHEKWFYDDSIEVKRSSREIEIAKTKKPRGQDRSLTSDNNPDDQHHASVSDLNASKNESKSLKEHSHTTAITAITMQSPNVTSSKNPHKSYTTEYSHVPDEPSETSHHDHLNPTEHSHPGHELTNHLFDHTIQSITEASPSQHASTVSSRDHTHAQSTGHSQNSHATKASPSDNDHVHETEHSNTPHVTTTSSSHYTQAKGIEHSHSPHVTTTPSSDHTHAQGTEHPHIAHVTTTSATDTRHNHVTANTHSPHVTIASETDPHHNHVTANTHSPHVTIASETDPDHRPAQGTEHSHTPHITTASTTERGPTNGTDHSHSPHVTTASVTDTHSTHGTEHSPSHHVTTATASTNGPVHVQGTEHPHIPHVTTTSAIDTHSTHGTEHSHSPHFAIASETDGIHAHETDHSHNPDVTTGKASTNDPVRVQGTEHPHIPHVTTSPTDTHSTQGTDHSHSHHVTTTSTTHPDTHRTDHSYSPHETTDPATDPKPTHGTEPTHTTLSATDPDRTHRTDHSHSPHVTTAFAIDHEPTHGSELLHTPHVTTTSRGHEPTHETDHSHSPPVTILSLREHDHAHGTEHLDNTDVTKAFSSGHGSTHGPSHNLSVTTASSKDHNHSYGTDHSPIPHATTDHSNDHKDQSSTENSHTSRIIHEIQPGIIEHSQALHVSTDSVDDIKHHSGTEPPDKPDGKDVIDHSSGLLYNFHTSTVSSDDHTPAADESFNQESSVISKDNRNGHSAKPTFKYYHAAKLILDTTTEVIENEYSSTRHEYDIKTSVPTPTEHFPHTHSNDPHDTTTMSNKYGQAHHNTSESETTNHDNPHHIFHGHPDIEPVLNNKDHHTTEESHSLRTSSSHGVENDKYTSSVTSHDKNHEFISSSTPYNHNKFFPGDHHNEVRKTDNFFLTHLGTTEKSDDFKITTPIESHSTAANSWNKRDIELPQTTASSSTELHAKTTINDIIIAIENSTITSESLLDQTTSYISEKSISTEFSAVESISQKTPNPHEVGRPELQDQKNSSITEVNPKNLTTKQNRKHRKHHHHQSVIKSPTFEDHVHEIPYTPLVKTTEETDLTKVIAVVALKNLTTDNTQEGSKRVETEIKSVQGTNEKIEPITRSTEPANMTTELIYSAKVTTEVPESVNVTTEVTEPIKLTTEVTDSAKGTTEVAESVNMTTEVTDSVKSTTEMKELVQVTTEIKQTQDISTHSENSDRSTISNNKRQRKKYKDSIEQSYENYEAGKRRS